MLAKAKLIQASVRDLKDRVHRCSLNLESISHSLTLLEHELMVLNHVEFITEKRDAVLPGDGPGRLFSD